MTVTALRRLAELHPDTEIWWDSSPLVMTAWRDERQAAWTDQPELTAALDELSFGSLQGVLRGCTTNPPLALEALERDVPSWLGWACAHRSLATTPAEFAWRTYLEVLRRGAEQVLPLWEQSAGACGQICGQVDPRQAAKRDIMVQQGIELHTVCPNVMVKMPATAAGIEGIGDLSALGISTNATLGFSVSQIMATARAAQAGMAIAREHGIDLSRTRSMATLMLGRMEDAPTFAESAASVGITLTETERRWAGVAVARRAYRELRAAAMPTKLLLASMRLGPTADGETRIWHLEQLAGGDAVLTIFPNILARFMEDYASRPLAATMDEPVPAAVLDRLREIPYFVAAYGPDAIPADDFDRVPGVVLTGSSFADSMQRFEDTVAAAWE